jgi:hypothetical protein
MTEQDPPEVGSIAEETAKLFGALSGWAKEHGGDLGAGAAAAFHEASSHVGNGDDCRYCPFCRVVNVVRTTSPEVRTHLALAAANIAQAAAAVLATAVPDEERAARKEPVEKIDLDDEGTDDFGPFEGPFG